MSPPSSSRCCAAKAALLVASVLTCRFGTRVVGRWEGPGWGTNPMRWPFRRKPKPTLDEVMVRWGDEIRPIMRTAIALDALPGGTSRFVLGGSRAHLPPGEMWPSTRGVPLLLLAEIDLSEIDFADLPLPKGGLLQAFVIEDDYWEDDSDYRLFLRSPDEPRVPVVSPRGGKPGAGVAFRRIETIPEELPETMTMDEIEILMAAYPGAAHQLLGHPQWVQPSPFEGGEAPTLVLQIGSDDALGWSWGDWGTNYFHADGDAFREGRLESVSFTSQCH